VLAISGSPSLERLEKFLHAGGIEVYLYKPFGKEELIDAIEKVFRGEYMKFHENA
jgi:DNA-binding NarL/FixJ family response regulator